jgi:uncharacterized protein
MKLLLWVALIACAIWLLRNKKSALQAGQTARPPRAASAAEVMVVCAHCDVHFPASEAIADGSGAVFCGDEHRRLHTSR